MRIVAGKYGSRRLKGPRNLRIRPTSDRLRETLFNILGAGVAGGRFLDICAGTGAVGIEALSRGAREVIFIEADRTASALIRSNLDALEIKTGAEIISTDAVSGLRKLATRGLRADFIFLDPAYADAAEYQLVLAFLEKSPLLSPDGKLIVEHSRKRTLPEQLGRLERVRVVEQGDAALSFYRVRSAVSASNHEGGEKWRL